MWLMRMWRVALQLGVRLYKTWDLCAVLFYILRASYEWVIEKLSVTVGLMNNCARRPNPLSETLCFK
jgi:hypothetical protein